MLAQSRAASTPTSPAPSTPLNTRRSLHRKCCWDLRLRVVRTCLVNRPFAELCTKARHNFRQFFHTSIPSSRVSPVPTHRCRVLIAQSFAPGRAASTRWHRRESLSFCTPMSSRSQGTPSATADLFEWTTYELCTTAASKGASRSTFFRGVCNACAMHLVAATCAAAARVVLHVIHPKIVYPALSKARSGALRRCDVRTCCVQHVPMRCGNVTDSACQEGSKGLQATRAFVSSIVGAEHQVHVHVTSCWPLLPLRRLTA